LYEKDLYSLKDKPLHFGQLLSTVPAKPIIKQKNWLGYV
jgi:hypothetical protein